MDNLLYGLERLKACVPQDSRFCTVPENVSSGDIFCCPEKKRKEAEHAVSSAIAKGASAVVAEEGLVAPDSLSVPLIEMKGLGECSELLSGLFYNRAWAREYLQTRREGKEASLPEASLLGERLSAASPKNAKIRLDSRKVAPGDVFAAIVGTVLDGRRYIKSAVEKGASLILVEEEGWEPQELGVPVVPVKDLNRKIGEIASVFYGEPSEKMYGIAVTGTNGKTSSAQWIAALLTEAGFPCGVIGTLGCSFRSRNIDGECLTTPDSVTLQYELKCFLELGAKAFVMEASSIGLEQGRMNGTRILTGIFTNFTRDHLDYHKTMERYLEAKLKLLDLRGLRALVLNAESGAAKSFEERAARKHLRVMEYSTDPSLGAELEALDIQTERDGLSFTLKYGEESARIRTHLFGHFNVENLLGVVGGLLEFGLPFREIARLLPDLRPPKGRLEKVPAEEGPLVVVDYAHTPDALEVVIDTLSETVRTRGGKLWVLAGCGGDRDPGKRPMMGAAAARGDFPILTTDNPRTEDPVKILEQMAKGAPHARIITDRAEAIRFAVANAHENDVVLIAGKGHEDYQDVQGVKHHFSDAEQAAEALKLRKTCQAKE